MFYVLPLIGALVITLAMAPTSAAVQTVPYKLNFQGRLAGASGAALTGSYDMQLKLYTAVTGGTYVWGETRTAANGNAVTVTNGLFSVMIGEGTAVAGSSASLEAAIATNQTLYLEVIVGAETLTPRNQLGSSAFAMNADKLDGLDSIDLIQNQTASAQAASFRINGSGTAATLSATTTINLGTASSSTGTMVLNNSGNANTVTLRAGTTATSYTLTLPTADGNTGDCLKDSNGSGVLAFSSCASGDSISVNGTAATDANFLDTAATGTSTGVTFTLSTAANPDTIAVTIGNASATVAGAVTTGTQTFAGDKTFNDSITLAAAKTLNLTGGTTANRPASPTEGMLYYDTDTKQLLTYANGKWQADRSEAILVAASNSSVADKAAADYVGDGDTAAAGDGDQVQINSALTAASGKKVVLLAGTYTADATILIPNNTTLAGVGAGTLIQLADIDVSDNLIENTDTAAGTGVTIQDMKLDGQKSLNTAGTQNGIYLNGMGDGVGATARQGAKVTNIWVNDFRTYGIYLDASSNNTVSGNTAQSNGSSSIFLSSSSNNTVSGNTVQGNGNGILLSSSSNNTVTGNTTQGNTSRGILLSISSNNNTVTGNTVQGNGSNGIELYSNSNNTVTGNTVQGSTNVGILLLYSSSNTVTGNKIDDNGGATNNRGIYLEGADSNTITSNDITDTYCGTGTTTCFAIIIDADSDTNYLADNRFSDTDADATATIQNLGTGTVYANQSLAENGGNITNRTANSTTAFQIQNATGLSLVAVDSTNSQLVLGQSSSVNGKLALNNSTNTNKLTLVSGATASNITLTLPTALGAAGDCLKDTTGTGVLGFGACGTGGGGGTTQTIVLAPEFTGAVMQADGSNNAGTMNAGYTGGLAAGQGYKHNYYQWTTSNTSVQDYSIIVNTQVPSDYASGLTNLKIWGYASSTTLATATIQLTDHDGTTCYASPVSFTPSTASTWEQKTVGTMTGCTFTANDIITVTIGVTAEDDAVFRVGEVSYEYTN